MTLYKNHYRMELCLEGVVNIALSVFKKTQDVVIIPFPVELKWHAHFFILFLTADRRL